MNISPSHNNAASDDSVFDSEVVMRIKTPPRAKHVQFAPDTTDAEAAEMEFQPKFEYMDIGQLPRHSPFITKILSITIKEITVDSSWKEDPEMKDIVDKYTSMPY